MLFYLGAYEGMCSASMVTNINPVENNSERGKGGNFSRTLSFSIKRGLHTTPDKNKFNRKYIHN